MHGRARSTLRLSGWLAVLLFVSWGGGCGEPGTPSRWRVQIPDDCAQSERVTELIRARARAMSAGMFGEAFVERRERQLAVELSSHLPAAEIQRALATLGVLAFHDVRLDPAEVSSEDVMVLPTESESLIIEKQPFLAPAIVDASQDFDSRQMPVVALELAEEEGARLREESAARIGERIAVLLDGELLTAPYVMSVVGRHSQIEGGFAVEEARAVSVALVHGPLPCPVRVSEAKE